MSSSTPSRPTSKSSGTTSNATGTPVFSSPVLGRESFRLTPSTTSSSSRLKSPASWKPNKKLFQHNHRSIRPLCGRPLIRWTAAIFTVALALLSLRSIYRQDTIGKLPDEWQSDARIQEVIQPTSGNTLPTNKESPEEWIKRQSAMADAEKAAQPRPKAALISLVRNEELDGILQSMRQLEYHWNHNYNYPWIFFSEKPFTDEFKAATSNITAAHTQYELVTREHWSTPSWVDQERYMNSLDYLGTIGVGKGHLLSYRAMCRWNSGFFYKHPALAEYEYYWRVEPDVHFFCHIPYDPFLFLSHYSLVYGFNIALLEDARSFPSLWRVTRSFISQNPHLIHPQANLSWLLDAQTGDYNNCQFFSNFEIASLTFFRSPPAQSYFNYLDASGGFFYERFGDAPIHTLSVSMFAPKEKIWWFRDIGYQHDIARHCPPKSGGRCACESTGVDENFYKLVPMESPQRKPVDSCIRAWLGGEWVEKRKGWNREAELAWGGDGLGGYVKEG